MPQLTNEDMNRYRFQNIHSGSHCGRRIEGAAPGAYNSISEGVVFGPILPRSCIFLVFNRSGSTMTNNLRSFRALHTTLVARPSHREILRLRVRDDDRRGRLLRVELVLLAEGDAHLVGAQQRKQLFLVAEIGTGGIAEGIAAAAIALVEHSVEIARLLGGEAELAADALVEIFGHRLGHLDREAVKIKVVLVAVLREPLTRHLGRAMAHGDHLETDDVAFAIADIAEEIGDP